MSDELTDVHLAKVSKKVSQWYHSFMLSAKKFVLHLSDVFVRVRVLRVRRWLNQTLSFSVY